MPFGGGAMGLMGRGGGGPMMPFGFPDMSQIFQAGAAGGNCHSFSSSTITTMSNGPDGRPQVYQASQSVRRGPGGVKETKKAVADSRSGIKRMAIGHHIGDRAHIVEREHNLRSGEHVENQEYINLEEEEAPEFDQEWRQKTRSAYSASNAIGYQQPGGSASGRYGGQRYGGETPAIMPAPSSARNYRSGSNYDVPPTYPALPPTSSGRHTERETVQHEGAVEEEEDEEECGVKIVEVDDDDDYEGGERKTEDASNVVEEVGEEDEVEAEEEPVVYVAEEDTSRGGAKGGQRSRGKKRSHEPDVTQHGHKSQKVQNRP
ncbi:myeloid leukemia factor 2 isoform X2 [Nilaparvata lugens]|uniref:myeloid leukemia factor 2 isoform X2 n=1 Tax=Nilaparvata lugens TaxID=108931 RepID=UPI00193E9DD3|nr:myeloid leukemia factor 2 isoform X2 [Nilaparvata lugens]